MSGIRPTQRFHVEGRQFDDAIRRILDIWFQMIDAVSERNCLYFFTTLATSNVLKCPELQFHPVAVNQN
jgi:hypothetical protein